METILFDKYVPDYSCSCEICGQSPCVTAVNDGEVVYDSGMCGPCTWGEARTLDPDTWNEEID